MRANDCHFLPPLHIMQRTLREPHLLPFGTINDGAVGTRGTLA